MTDDSEFEWGVSGPLFAGLTMGELRELEARGWAPERARLPVDDAVVPSTKHCEHEWHRLVDTTTHTDAVVVWRDGVDPVDEPQIRYAIDCAADAHPTEAER